MTLLPFLLPTNKVDLDEETLRRVVENCLNQNPKERHHMSEMGDWGEQNAPC